MHFWRVFGFFQYNFIQIDLHHDPCSLDFFKFTTIHLSIMLGQGLRETYFNHILLDFDFNQDS